MYREGRGEGLCREWKRALPVPRGSCERIGFVYALCRMDVSPLAGLNARGESRK